MLIELTLGNLAAVALTFLTVLFGLVKIIAIQQDKRLEAQFITLGQSIQGVNANMVLEQQTIQRLERELLQFKAELPRDYVRREDFIRAVGTIGTQIDNLALRMERAVLTSRSDK